MKLYDFIIQYKREHGGIAPSYQEIKEACGISISRVRKELEKLEQAGLVILRPGPRSIGVVGERWET